MRTNLKFPCWLLLVVGVLTTAYFASDMKLSWLLVVGPWMLLPYVVLAFALRAAPKLAARAVVLVATLGVVCYGFWVYFDRAFVHFSSIDFSPIEIPLEQLLVAVGSWFVVRRIAKGALRKGGIQY